MNADHKFAALDWNYASVQDTSGNRELKSIDGDFPTFEIDQNKAINVGPSTSRALILQEPVIYACSVTVVSPCKGLQSNSS